MKIGKLFLGVALTVGTLQAARGQNRCEPIPPAACNEEACCRTYCLGPENYGVNAPVNPMTCNGDWVISLAGFYWNFHQDSMELAINNGVTEADWENNQQFIDAKYIMPKTDWDFGFKIGLGYNTTCDGWDFGVKWTHYQGSTHTHIDVQPDENRLLLSLWSYVNENGGDSTLADITDMKAEWKLDLDLVDLSLGRAYWNSKRLSLRPFIGLRYAKINQNLNILSKGGQFSEDFNPDVNNEVDVNNDFHGFGFRGGFDSVWNFGCGWGIYGDLALSLVYGRFSIDHQEQNRQAQAPFTKSRVLEIEHSFRVIRYITDIEVGIQWSSLVCDCQYGVSARLGWEAHLFFDQNQMRRYVHDGDDIMITPLSGSLDTQGWTLSFSLAF